MRKFNYENLEREKWDAEIINLLTQIHEHRGKQPQEILLKFFIGFSDKRV